MNPFFLTDGYKTSHHLMYPKGTKLVYSNLTPRSNRYAPKGCEQMVCFGPQFTMQYIYEVFEREFFAISKKTVCDEIKREYSMYLNCDYDVSHIEALHDLGYLPLCVKALPEGTLVPMGVPVLTIYNTKKEFYWLTNFLETLISNLLWKPMTSASIAYTYKNNLMAWAEKTDVAAKEFVNFQGHDFSMRGMDSPLACMTSGMGHATSFMGSDSLPVIKAARKYYGATEFVVGSVNATEHSIMCSGGAEEGDEIATFRHLMKTFPTGILSVVSDTWDLWKVLTEYLPALKEEILARDGKIVIRPDSGDPVDIICGGSYNSIKDIPNSPQYKGVIELLWDTFGGTVNDQGYKVLDPHIGAIYGDSITLERADNICQRLADKGFASTNVVLGIGSFTYQYNTRDTFGTAMKATYVELEEAQEPVSHDGLNVGSITPDPKTICREIFKDPITDQGGFKKSAKGLLLVQENDFTGDYELIDQVSWKQEGHGCLQTIFEDGTFRNITTLDEIRERLNECRLQPKLT